MFLQSYTVPVVLYDCEIEKGKLTSNIKKVIGSSFYASKDGWILTASHVIKKCNEEIKQKQDMKIGFVVKGEEGSNQQSYISPLENYEFAPDPYDICICKIGSHIRDDFFFYRPDVEVAMFQKVATFGYPLNALHNENDIFQVNIRGQKGIVQRIIQENQLTYSNPISYELDFLISGGSSGSPLFIPNKKDGTLDLIGVCVGSYQSEETDFEHVEIESNGNTFKEKKMKITQFGIAEDLLSLADWHIDIASKNLIDIIK